MTNWVIENWDNKIDFVSPTIFHAHDEYKVFILRGQNSCPICKEPIPRYILFQWKLLEAKSWSREFYQILIQKNNKMVYKKFNPFFNESFTVIKDEINKEEGLISLLKEHNIQINI